MIIFDNNWLRFFESPIVNLFFVLTLLGLFGTPLVRFLGKVYNRVKPPERRAAE